MPEIICPKCSIKMQYSDGVYTCSNCEHTIKHQSPLFPSEFRKLNIAELSEFRKWARNNYQVGTHINNIWHPAVRAECEIMNLEALQGESFYIGRLNADT